MHCVWFNGNRTAAPSGRDQQHPSVRRRLGARPPQRESPIESAPRRTPGSRSAAWRQSGRRQHEQRPVVGRPLRDRRPDDLIGHASRRIRQGLLLRRPERVGQLQADRLPQQVHALQRRPRGEFHVRLGWVRPSGRRAHQQRARGQECAEQARQFDDPPSPPGPMSQPGAPSH